MPISEALVTTSFIPALLSFAVAVCYWRHYQKDRDDKAIKVTAFCFWGTCYLLNQFQVSWFVPNQVLFFRNANVIVMFSLLYPFIKTSIKTMLQEIKIIYAKRNIDSS